MEKTTEFGLIRLPNNPAILPALIKYARKIAEIIGFSSRDSKKIQLAVEEACLTVINKSFMPGEDAEFDICFYKLLNGIEIHVHDMGLPFDPATELVYNPSAVLAEKELDGLGTYLIRKTMDEYRFNNLGIRGKEVVFIKYFDTPLIAHGREQTAGPEVVKPPEGASPTEQIDFDIRLMNPEEAPEVCRCIYDCYGYSYANENIYYPERVAAMNQNGKLRSAVAVTREGEMAGHFALIFYDKLPAEIGIAVTKKKFRGQGFARQLGDFLESEARSANLTGMQIKEVTAHPYTQKFCMKLGYKDCGLLLAHSPRTLSFKGIADKLKQRNSDVLGFKYLVKPTPRRLFVPLHHIEMIRMLYNNIGDTAECVTTFDPVPAFDKSVTEVNIHALRSLAEMFIIETGADIIPTVRNEMRKIFMEEIQVIELYISLSDPMTQVIVSQLENLGFLFTGILPETLIGDAIIMQYFNGVYFDYNEIILVSDVAKQLLQYIRSHDSHAGEMEFA
jgi:serine/threonine-protein kinase RsbW